MRRLRLMLLATMVLLVPAAAASAAGRTPVDPSIMQPALNPDFTWTCWRMDNKTICDGELHASWTASDIGIPCAGGTATQPEPRPVTAPVGRRRGPGPAHPRARRHQRTLALNPEMTGTTARLTAHFSQRFLYGVPADASTRVEVLSGNDITVVVPAPVWSSTTSV